MSDHYDVIVIGSGPGGASVAHRLAPTGKRILLLERGDYLPRSPANWDSQTVFVDGAYQAPETWYGADGSSFHPGLHYYVGGNSKVYGAALFRLRERDFDEIVHKDGISPAWPLKYDAFEPYYAEAERLFHVHGQRGEDPTEPPSSGPFPYPPVSHEPRIAALSESLAREGLHPFHLPLGILLDEKDGKPTPTSICIRCDAFDGFPCLLNGKADAQVICVDPALQAHPNLTLLTGAYVSRLETDAIGTDGYRRPRHPEGRGGALLGRHRRRRLRRVVVGAAAAALGQRQASERARQRLRPGRAQLHAPQPVDPDGADARAQRHRLSEDARRQRLLFRFRRLGVSARPDPDVRNIARRADPRRGASRLARMGAKDAV